MKGNQDVHSPNFFYRKSITWRYNSSCHCSMESKEVNRKTLMSTLLLEGRFKSLHRYGIYIEPLIADYYVHRDKQKFHNKLQEWFYKANMEALIDYSPDGTLYRLYNANNHFD